MPFNYYKKLCLIEIDIWVNLFQAQCKGDLLS